MHIIIHIIKLVLVLLSLSLADFNRQNNNKQLVTYWLVVALYWAVNLLQGLI